MLSYCIHLILGNLCRCTGYRPILEGLKTFTKNSNFGCGKENCCQMNNGYVYENGTNATGSTNSSNGNITILFLLIL